MPEGADVYHYLHQHDRAGAKLAKLAGEAPLYEPGANDGEADDGKADGGNTDDADDADDADDGDDAH
jgi:hypothetical protein